jgi:hypothetical protein
MSSELVEFVEGKKPKLFLFRKIDIFRILKRPFRCWKAINSVTHSEINLLIVASTLVDMFSIC